MLTIPEVLVELRQFLHLRILALRLDRIFGDIVALVLDLRAMFTWISAILASATQIVMIGADVSFW
jgi:hypothetical protein